MPAAPAVRRARSRAPRRPLVRVLVSVLATLGVAAALLTGTSGPAPAQAVTDQRAAVLGFFYDYADWVKVIESGASTGFAVLDPASGPGNYAYEHWTDMRQRLRVAGVRTIGYVYTDAGRKPLADTLDEVQRYLSLYDVDGIYLDGVTNTCGTAGSVYHGQVVDGIRTRKPGAFVVMNPIDDQRDIDECYATMADAVLAFSGPKSRYDAWSPPAWSFNHPATKFWHLVWDVPTAQLAATVASTKAKRAGYAFVTDRSTDPLVALPSQSSWNAMLTAIRGTYTPTPQPARPRIASQFVGVPAFFAQADKSSVNAVANWQRLLASPADTKAVIINPFNGPGTRSAAATAVAARARALAPADATAGVERLSRPGGPGDAVQDELLGYRATARANGQKVYGYVSTQYSARAAADVIADVRKYVDWYDIDGVFLDQVTPDCNTAPFYADLAAQSRAVKPGLLVAYNAGVNVAECYAAAPDVIVNFEGTASRYFGYSPSLWVDRYPPEKFWHLVYGTDAGVLANVIELSKTRRAGTIYASDDALPNPWDTFTGERYDRQERALVRGRAISTSPDVVPLLPARLLDTRGLGAPLGAGSSARIQVLGQAGIPTSGVDSVIVNVTGVGSDTGGYLTVYPSGTALPATSNVNLVAGGRATPNLAVVKVGADGTITVTNAFGTTHVLVDVLAYLPSGTRLAASGTPRRVVDTRTGVGAPVAKVGPGGQVAVAVTPGAPAASGVTAAVLSVIGVTPSTSTFLTAWPSGEARPATSNLNVSAGQVTPNLVIAKVGADGKVLIANDSGNVDVVVDLLGTIGTGSTIVTTSPQRVADTRSGIGVAAGKVGGGGELVVPVGGRGGVPAGATAAILNVTVADPDRETFVSVFPGLDRRPEASNVNVLGGENRANLVVAALASDGTVRIANASGSVHLIVDVFGYVTG